MSAALVCLFWAVASPEETTKKDSIRRVKRYLIADAMVQA
jgi:hypothetical protein